jgi:uncharacterized protein
VTTAGLEAYTEAAALPAGDWDSLLGPDDLYLSTRWLRIAEAESAVPMTYLLARRAGTPTTTPPALAPPVAALATAEVDVSAPWRLGRPDTLLAIAAEEGRPGARECLAALPGDLGAALLPGLVCGGRHLGQTAVLRGAHATRADVADLVTAAERLATSKNLRSVSFLYVDDADTVLRDELSARGYLRHDCAELSRLPLPPGGYDAYQRQLSPRRRKRVRAERRKIAAAGVDAGVEPLSAHALPRLGALEAQLFAKYGMPGWSAELSQRFLARVLDVFGTDALVSLTRADGEIRGFALLLPLRDRWFLHRVGFDYAFQAEHHLTLYYETLFYAPVERAAVDGITAIHYGIGSVEAKRSRGCTASTQHAYVLPLRSRAHTG